MKGFLVFAAWACNEVEKIKMNEIWFVILQSTRKCCVGTLDLNDCSVVAIVSLYTAILTHISLTPDMISLSSQVKDQNVWIKIDKVAILFN